MKHMVTWVPELKQEHEGTFLICTEGKFKMRPFPSCNSKAIDVEQPELFEIHVLESHECRLNKYFYVLKHEP